MCFCCCSLLTISVACTWRATRKTIQNSNALFTSPTHPVPIIGTSFYDAIFRFYLWILLILSTPNTIRDGGENHFRCRSLSDSVPHYCTILVCTGCPSIVANKRARQFDHGRRLIAFEKCMREHEIVSAQLAVGYCCTWQYRRATDCYTTGRIRAIRFGWPNLLYHNTKV